MSLAPSDSDNASPAPIPPAPPAAPTPHARAPRSRVLQMAVLLLAVSPMGFLAGQVWTANAELADIVAAERAATATARPLNSLLAALVDAQYTAARSISLDDSGIRAGVGEVNRVKAAQGDLMRIERRWNLLAAEIESVLARRPTGAEAVRAYAVPIAMNRELLSWVADSSQISRDPASSFHLVDVGLKRAPEVLAIAGDLASLAHTAPTDTRLPILRDRISRAAQEVSAGLGAASVSPDLPLLSPLDEFASSADALSRATTREDVEATMGRLRPAGLALELSALNAFDTVLADTTGDLAAQRSSLLIAAGVTTVSAIALGWLIISRRRVPAHAAPAPPAEPAEPRTERRTPNVIDARELLARR